MALTICSLLLFLTSCKSDKDISSTNTDLQSQPEVVYYTNNLTGEEVFTDEQKVNNRPVAVMINNISTAQPVQTGLTKADIVYETEVEGGITRLLAVYKDISSVEKLGTVRSARYAYIDLAMGHDAIYVHHGMDYTYAASHLKDAQTFALGTNNAGVRIKNGLASEHTLYGYGDKMWDYLVNHKYNTKLDKVENWQKFADKDTAITYESVANTVTVPFSNAYKSVFKYDTESGKYVRYFKDTLRRDYNTGESEYFKNIFVLETSIVDYPDGYHRKIDLSSGNGYYCVNGTYTPIKWAKGTASSGFKFTLEDGTPLEVNQGNSWVCIHGQKFASSFE